MTHAGKHADFKSTLPRRPNGRVVPLEITPQLPTRSWCRRIGLELLGNPSKTH